MRNKPRGRIEAEGVGIGAVSDKLLQRRAQDLAEGREFVHGGDHRQGASHHEEADCHWGSRAIALRAFI